MPLVVGRAAAPPHVALVTESEAPPDARRVAVTNLRVADVVVVPVDYTSTRQRTALLLDKGGRASIARRRTGLCAASGRHCGLTTRYCRRARGERRSRPDVARRRRARGRGTGGHDDDHAAAQEATTLRRSAGRAREPLGRGLGRDAGRRFDHTGRASAIYPRAAGRARATGYVVRGRRADCASANLRGCRCGTSATHASCAGRARASGLCERGRRRGRGPENFTKKQLLALMPGGMGSIVPAVYVAGGTIYALAFSEASNPGLPTVLEISAGAQRARQVAVLDELRRNNGVAPLFVCLRTRRGRHECVPGSSCKAFRFAGYRAVVSVERHDPPKLVGGEVRQATITLGGATAAPCPLTATPAAAPPATPAARPPVLSPVTSQRSASPFLPPAALSPAAPPPVPVPPAATRRRAQTRRYADVPDAPASR